MMFKFHTEHYEDMVMINIQACKKDVEDIVSIVRHSSEIDAAVFLPHQKD